MALLTLPPIQRAPARSASRETRTWFSWPVRCGRLLLLLGSLCSGTHVARGADAEVSKEYQLKAAFLYNFTKFVEWPPQRFLTAESPIVIGVLGRSPFGDEMARTVRDRKVGGRALVIKTIADSNEATSVDLLFIPAGEEQQLAGSLASINGAGVLTVGESALFAALGGMITFSTAEEKVRFEINRAVAERAGLKISAQLLKLAVKAPRKS